MLGTLSECNAVHVCLDLQLDFESIGGKKRQTEVCRMCSSLVIQHFCVFKNEQSYAMAVRTSVVTLSAGFPIVHVNKKEIIYLSQHQSIFGKRLGCANMLNRVRQQLGWERTRKKDIKEVSFVPCE